MCHQTLLTLFVLTELFLKINELDPSIVGSWFADGRALMVVTLPTDKVSRHQLMGLAGCWFFPNGTAVLTVYIVAEDTGELERVRLSLRWRTQESRQGSNLLYLYSEEKPYLVARYRVKAKSLWLTFFLEEEKSRKEAPMTFDPFREDNVAIFILLCRSAVFKDRETSK